MKIYRRGPHSPPVEMAFAIAGTITDRSDGGAIERAHDKADKCAEIVGQLVQALYENRQLTNEQVVSMLGFRYESTWD